MKEAERDAAYRVVKRLHAVVLNSEGRTSGEIADILKASLSGVSEWLRRYESYGYEGLLEGQRSRRPSGLSLEQRTKLIDILDSGPIAYGFTSGVWTSPMVTRVIEEEFDRRYHAGHVRKILADIGFSVQRPKRVLARADPKAQNRWRRYTYPKLTKRALEDGAAIIFVDEATFYVAERRTRCGAGSLPAVTGVEEPFHAAWQAAPQPICAFRNTN